MASLFDSSRLATSRSILLVEDDHEIAETLINILKVREAKFSVTHVKTVAEAEALIRAASFDLVICDNTKGDARFGVDLWRLSRSSFLILSSETEQETFGALFGPPERPAFLKKPFNPRDFATVVGDLLGLSSRPDAPKNV